jgi:hypothetical protein
MIGPKHCPYCHGPASRGCGHLALAAEGREFVRRCVELCAGQRQWRSVCEVRRRRKRQTGEWTPERDDFQWLETAFCDEFLKRLAWFGSIDYEWRSGPKPGQGGFWVLLWSKDPRRLWWDLRDEFERQSQAPEIASGYGVGVAPPLVPEAASTGISARRQPGTR